MAETRFSVVIVHRNGAQMLMDALTALAQACSAQDEVIVVDNGSGDDSVVRVKAEFPTVRVIENGCNNGFARACNQGLRLARGEFVLFLNNDAIVPSDALERFYADFTAYPRAALIGGQLLGADGRPQRSAGEAPGVLTELGLRRRKHPDVSRRTAPVEVETLVGACMALRRAALAEAGPMDEDFFFYFEETEWCVRLRRHGWQVLVDPRIRITHLRGASTRGVRRDAQVEVLRSRLLYYWKTMPREAAALLCAWRVVRVLVNTASNLALVLLTLGLVRGLRARLAIYATQLAWLALGRPEHWGLPDKCPRGLQG